jgi:hypothetical protein
VLTDLLVSRPTGYLIETPPGTIDAHRFEAGVREGRQALAEGDPANASARLRDALSLWRGPALAEFAGHAFADATIARLEGLRLGATEDRVEADLAMGRHAELVPELEELVTEHPLRERLRGQLMLALYRSGRQAEALQVYHDTREVLDDELGLDPSPALTHRYEELLRQEDRPPTPSPAPATVPHATPASPVQLAASAPPAPLTSFVGREDELPRVLDLLRDARLVTLTGPGGVGKTRLAVEAARSLRDDPLARDGVLDGVSSSDHRGLLWPGG